VSPPAGFCGMVERFSRWPVRKAAGELVDGIVERPYLRLKTPQAFLDLCALGFAPWS
jgi:hypothetical protein